MKLAFTSKWVIGGACLLVVLIVVGSYFGSHWYYGDIEPVPEELLRYTPSPPVSRGVSKERSAKNDGPATGSVSDSSDVAVRVDDEIGDFSEDIPVYYFPDGTPVPEHLLCPEKWVGAYISSLDKTEYAEAEQHIQAVAREIVANYNPNRPLAEVWYSFIEAEQQLWAQSEDAGKIQSVGSNRIDWMYEQIRNFPEIFKLISEEGPSGMWSRVYRVEMGDMDPDWNLEILPDGRKFRAEYGYRYRFTSVASNYNYVEFCSSDLDTAELVVVDNYEQLSNVELERLGGWNYNFNPYTGE